ncbi:hypothetical protein [Calothrix sp. NIES-2098]|uniref:hypothetical protein n=1 Tax=Calothrix sp. NIES-2098 TaxID=1954171 RepID=UPI0030D95BA1
MRGNVEQAYFSALAFKKKRSHFLKNTIAFMIQGVHLMPPLGCPSRGLKSLGNTIHPVDGMPLESAFID